LLRDNAGPVIEHGFLIGPSLWVKAIGGRRLSQQIDSLTDQFSFGNAQLVGATLKEAFLVRSDVDLLTHHGGHAV
jgi:hypothetical protein